MAVYEKASGEYPMNAGFYGAPGIAAETFMLQSVPLYVDTRKSDIISIC